MEYLGTTGDDTITGTNQKDYFDMSQGGNDHVYGGDGRDTFYFGAALTADDVIDGGSGYNILELRGDYSAGLLFNTAMITNIGLVKLDKGFDYNLTLDSGVDYLAIAAKAGHNHSFTLDGSAYGGGLTITTNAGHNDLTGGAGNDTFDFGKVFNFANDRVDGGDGQDTILLDGDYDLTFDGMAASAVVSASFKLEGGHDYDIVVNASYGQSLELYYGNEDDYVAGQHISIDASASAAAVFVDNQVYADSTFDVIMGSGDDFIEIQSHGTAQHTVDLTHGGADTVEMGAYSGTLTVLMGDTFTAQDRISGLEGSTVIVKLDGDYSAGINFTGTNSGISEFDLAGGHSYSFTTNGLLGAKYDGSALGENDHLYFNGAAQRGDGYTVIGGDGDDTLIGGRKDNVLTGGHGADSITGGMNDDTITGGGGADLIAIGSGGKDTIVYAAATDSSIAYDTVTGFSFRNDDHFVMTGAVTGIDAAVTHGQLDGDMGGGTFGSELTAALDGAHLQAQHAVLFTPDSGSLAGSVFLVVDQNGVAGFQSGEDIVIKVDSGALAGFLDASDFRTH